MKKLFFFGFLNLLSFASLLFAARISGGGGSGGGGNATVAGSNTNVQYNNGGALGGDNGFQYDSSVSSITVGGRIKATSHSTVFTYDDGGKFGSIGNGDPAITLDDESGSPGAVLRFLSGGVLGSYWADNTGSFDIGAATANAKEALTRISLSHGSSGIRFMNPSSGIAVDFDTVGNSTYSIPVVLSTLTISSQFTASSGTVNGQFSAIASSANIVPIIARAAASQTADLQDWKDASGNTVASIDKKGQTFTINKTPGYAFLTLGSVDEDPIDYAGMWLAQAVPGFSNYAFLGGVGQTFLNAANSGSADIELRIGNSTHLTVGAQGAAVGLASNASPSSTQEFFVQPDVAGKIGTVIEGAASQSANLQEWQNSSGVALSSVSASGNFTASTFTATKTYIFSDASKQSSSAMGLFSGALFVGLTSGSTFQAFVPPVAITLKNISFTADVASVGGSGDTFTCGDASGNKIAVVSANAAAAGTLTTAISSASISAGTTVYMRMDSGAATKPQGNLTCAYVMQ